VNNHEFTAAIEVAKHRIVAVIALRPTHRESFAFLIINQPRLVCYLNSYTVDSRLQPFLLATSFEHLMKATLNDACHLGNN
jgi:hypothetical protein